jgi:hypothetical protein
MLQDIVKCAPCAPWRTTRATGRRARQGQLNRLPSRGLRNLCTKCNILQDITIYCRSLSYMGTLSRSTRVFPFSNLDCAIVAICPPKAHDAMRAVILTHSRSLDEAKISVQHSNTGRDCIYESWLQNWTRRRFPSSILTHSSSQTSLDHLPGSSVKHVPVLYPCLKLLDYRNLTAILHELWSRKPDDAEALLMMAFWYAWLQ